MGTNTKETATVEQINQYLRENLLPIFKQSKHERTVAQTYRLWELNNLLTSWVKRIDKELDGWTPDTDEEWLDKQLFGHNHASDLGVMHGKPQINKIKTFMDIFNDLNGINNKDIEVRNLVYELVKTGKFTEEEANSYIKLAEQKGQIYERKTGLYSSATYN